MYDYEPAEVSRRRAAAIERLADDLRVQRGEDLGSVLKALLEPGTWSGIEPAPGREFAAPPRPRTAAQRRRPRTGRRPRADRAPTPPPAPSREPVRRRPCRSGPVPSPAARAREGAGARRPPPLAAVADPAPAPDEPVLDMLADGRRGGEGSGPPGPHGLPDARRAGRRRARGGRRPDGRHAALGDDDSGRLTRARARTTARATSCRPRAGRSRRRSPPIRSTSSCYSTAYVQQSHRPLRASPAASRACGSRSAPSGGRRACSAWSASAATGSGCRPRS